MSRKIRFTLLLLVCSLLISGCFGAREIDDLAIVMAVGIDKGKEPGHIRLTVQVVRPGDARGQTGAPSGGTGRPVWTASSEGASMFEAIRNLARFSSRRVFWAHNQIIVISEDLARSGINDVVDFFTRNHELRMRTWFVVTPGQASEVVSTKTGLEVVPGVSLNKLFRYSDIVAEAPRSDMRTFLAAYRSRTTHPVLAKAQLKKREVAEDKPQEFGSMPQVELSGTAVFNKDKMIGWLTPKESRAMLWFTETVESGIYPLPCPDDETPKNKTTSLELKHNEFEVIPSYQNDKVSFHVKLTAYMDIVELGCSTPLNNYTVKKRLENTMNTFLRQEITALTDKMQKQYKVDFLELGKMFQNRYPVEWRKLQNEWDKVLSKAEIVVEVDTYINSPVLLRYPTRPGKKE